MAKMLASLRTATLVAAVSTLIPACNPDRTGPGRTTNIGVPFVYQETAGDCAPACIQMCGRFNGRNVPGQQALDRDMSGGSADGVTDGVDDRRIAPELAKYGGIPDAFLDHAYLGVDSDQFFARQISAALHPSPVVALINCGYQAVVINGGQWHKATNINDETVYSWDSVYVHDPLEGPNQQYTAGTWLDIQCGSYGHASCYQILSHGLAASAPPASNYNVVLFGASDDNGGDGPQQY